MEWFVREFLYTGCSVGGIVSNRLFNDSDMEIVEFCAF